MPISYKKYNTIKAHLALKGKMSKDLADYTKKSKQTVSHWCTNKRQPTLDELFQVAEFLNVSPVDLLDLTDFKRQNQ